VLIDKNVLIERLVPGSVFRVITAGDRVIAASLVDAGESSDPTADLSQVIHPEIAAQAIAAAHALRLPVAVVEVIAADITKRLEDQGGVISGVRLLDSENPCRPAEQEALAQEVVSSLFPHHATGRIPCVAVLEDSTGAAANHLAALLTRAGLCAGIAGEKEIAIAGRSWTPTRKSPAERAKAIFQAPIVDIALLKLSHGELQCGGLGNDVCNVAVVLDSHPGDELLRGGLAEAGILVLPFERSVPQKEVSLPAERLIWFASQEVSTPPVELLVERGRALFFAAGEVVLAQGSGTRVALGKMPANLTRGELAPLLAALAAALALGHNINVLKEYLAT
jgi:cyanophycin synthetase